MLTGLVVGLGANPTHEIVRWVSESAKARRASNLGRPSVSESPDGRGEAAPGVAERLAPTGGEVVGRARPSTMNLR
jgi:hypothetical protein